jgi:hypothetical protein
VGIGVNNPTHRLHIIADDTTRGIKIENTVATSYAELNLKASREYRVGTAGSTATGTDPGNFYVYDASAGLHRFTISGLGNVGIGTTAPTAKLHISSGTSGDATLIIESDTDNNDENDNPQLQFKQDGGLVVAKAGITGGAGNIFTGSLENAAYLGNDANAPLQLYTSASARLTIGSPSGNVGIGTTAPTAKLHIHESTGTSPATAAGSLIISHGNSGGVSSIVFPSKVNAGSDYGFIQYKDNEALGFVTGTAENSLLEIGTQNDITATNSDQIAFSTGGTRRLFIQGDGKIGIGTTTPTAKLEVGTTSTTSDSIIRVLSGDSNKAGFEAYGSIQGTGYLYVGQSTTFGGGILYNGDDSPDLVGTTHDQTYFFRRSASIDIPVFSYGATSDTVTFYGGIRVTGGIGRTAHNVGHLEGSYNNIGNNDTNTNPIYTIGSGYTPTTTTLSNMYGIGYTRSGTGYASFLDANTSGWGMYVAADGDARVFLGASAGANSYFDAANVGIGTKNPTAKLHVVGTGNITGDTTIGGNLSVSGQAASVSHPEFGGVTMALDATDENIGCNVLYWNPDGKLQSNGTDTYGWRAYMGDFSTGTDLDLGFQSSKNGTTSINTRYITHGDSGQAFTGQHPCKPNRPLSIYQSKVGYIVSSIGTISNYPENWTEDTTTVDPLNSVTINESLPIVEMSDQPNDKKVYGVISQVDNPNSTERNNTNQTGGFNSHTSNRIDDRMAINSVGEGAIMVSNINGNLENGDYITTSAIEGVGMKQDDDLLHNYTVAKIVQDCDFSTDTTNVTHNGITYKMKLVGCTYHCG